MIQFADLFQVNCTKNTVKLAININFLEYTPQCGIVITTCFFFFSLFEWIFGSGCEKAMSRVQIE